jgi:ATP-dependent protease ClpP protease subunit
MMQNKWYDIKAQLNAANKAVSYDVHLMDEIGMWGITARDFAAEFAGIPKGMPIRLIVNSNGGSVIDAIAINNIIKARGDVTGVVYGIAASAATIILMACSKIEMPENTFLMIHGVSTYMYGQADDLREYADVMDKMNATLANTYAARTGQTIDVVNEWMSKDSWFGAAEAAAVGLCDEVTAQFALAAQMSSGMSQILNNAPAAVKAMMQAKTEPTEPQAQSVPAQDNAQEVLAAVTLCVNAGESELSKMVVNASIAAADVPARIERASALRSLAALADYPVAQVDDLIINNRSIAEATTLLQAYKKTKVPAVNNSVAAGQDFITPKGNEPAAKRLKARAAKPF